MKKNIRRVIFSVLCLSCAFASCSVHTASKKENEPVLEQTETMQPVFTEISYIEKTTPPPAVVQPGLRTRSLPQEDIELIALVTMAEAEGECEEGKRLVIDTILNRIDSDQFPDTVHDVVYQKYHFSSMWNGRVDRCEVREDICKLVKEELEHRTNCDVIYFNADGYSAYGIPMFQVGNHYFSRDERKE